MTNDNWFYTAIDLKHEIANRVESLGFQHVNVKHNFNIMRDTMEFDVYFCSDAEGRRRISLGLPAESLDIDALIRDFQDQLI